MPQLPAVAIILVIEHIAIAKAMGRQFSYTVNPSQEIVALGAANMFSPFVGGYVCTGSFGASAVLCKAGVRTPMAGVFSALVLILALYVLTAVFFFIPKAALAGLILHAVCNLIAPPKKVFKYWQLSPLEWFIWVICVLVAIFETLETSIYVGTALSIALLLVRLARTKGTFLGRVQARRVVADDEDGQTVSSTAEKNSREIFLPLDRRDASNPDIEVNSPYPGVFIYRFSEGYNYTNQAYHIDILLQHIMERTRRMTEEHFEKQSDRLWNDPGPRKRNNDANLPYLRAVVLDFSAVNNLDITCVQGLIDMRNSLDSYSAPDTVEWHFANVHNRWSRRALAIAGFGYPTAKNPEALEKWMPIYSIATSLASKDANPEQREGDVEAPNNTSAQTTPEVVTSDSETETKVSSPFPEPSRPVAAIYGVDRPFFHLDLLEAVEAAVRGAQNKDERPCCGRSIDTL